MLAQERELSDEPAGVDAENQMLAGQVDAVVGFYDHNIDLQANGKSTESVVQLGGVGQYAADSIASLDIPPVLAITMFGAFMVVLIGAVIDVVYAMLDPRIRL